MQSGQNKLGMFPSARNQEVINHLQDLSWRRIVMNHNKQNRLENERRKMGLSNGPEANVNKNTYSYDSSTLLIGVCSMQGWRPHMEDTFCVRIPSVEENDIGRAGVTLAQPQMSSSPRPETGASTGGSNTPADTNRVVCLEDASTQVQQLMNSMAECDKGPTNAVKSTAAACSRCCNTAVSSALAYLKAHPTPLANTASAILKRAAEEEKRELCMECAPIGDDAVKNGVVEFGTTEKTDSLKTYSMKQRSASTGFGYNIDPVSDIAYSSRGAGTVKLYSQERTGTKLKDYLYNNPTGYRSRSFGMSLGSYNQISPSVGIDHQPKELLLNPVDVPVGLLLDTSPSREQSTSPGRLSPLSVDGFCAWDSSELAIESAVSQHRIPQTTSSQPRITICGVFDGHGGSRTSSLVSRNIIDWIENGCDLKGNQMLEGAGPSSPSMGQGRSESGGGGINYFARQQYALTLYSAFTNGDRSLMPLLLQEWDYSGSTGVVVMIVEKEGGNVGALLETRREVQRVMAERSRRRVELFQHILAQSVNRKVECSTDPSSPGVVRCLLHGRPTRTSRGVCTIAASMEACGIKESSDSDPFITIPFEETQVLCANAGDSRALLVRNNGLVVNLSEDHKPGQAEERARIEAAGGFVTQDPCFYSPEYYHRKDPCKDPRNLDTSWLVVPNDPRIDRANLERCGSAKTKGATRVDGLVAVSRGFGDIIFKLNDNRTSDKQKVICIPDITRVAQVRDIQGNYCFYTYSQLRREMIASRRKEVRKQCKKEYNDYLHGAIGRKTLRPPRFNAGVELAAVADKLENEQNQHQNVEDSPPAETKDTEACHSANEGSLNQSTTSLPNNTFVQSFTPFSHTNVDGAPRQTCIRDLVSRLVEPDDNSPVCICGKWNTPTGCQCDCTKKIVRTSISKRLVTRQTLPILFPSERKATHVFPNVNEATGIIHALDGSVLPSTDPAGKPLAIREHAEIHLLSVPDVWDSETNLFISLEALRAKKKKAAENTLRPQHPPKETAINNGSLSASPCSSEAGSAIAGGINSPTRQQSQNSGKLSGASNQPPSGPGPLPAAFLTTDDVQRTCISTMVRNPDPRNAFFFVALASDGIFDCLTNRDLALIITNLIDQQILASVRRRRTQVSREVARVRAELSAVSPSPSGFYISPGGVSLGPSSSRSSSAKDSNLAAHARVDRIIDNYTDNFICNNIGDDIDIQTVCEVVLDECFKQSLNAAGKLKGTCSPTEEDELTRDAGGGELQGAGGVCEKLGAAGGENCALSSAGTLRDGPLSELILVSPTLRTGSAKMVSAERASAIKSSDLSVSSSPSSTLEETTPIDVQSNSGKREVCDPEKRSLYTQLHSPDSLQSAGPPGMVVGVDNMTIIIILVKSALEERARRIAADIGKEK